MRDALERLAVELDVAADAVRVLVGVDLVGGRGARTERDQGEHSRDHREQQHERAGHARTRVLFGRWPRDLQDLGCGRRSLRSVRRR